MIQMQSRLVVADNTGIKEVMCIKVLGGSKRRYAKIGDIIVVSIKKSDPTKKGVEKAMIVRTTNKIRRKNGVSLRFDDNACVIVSAYGTPKGTRISGPIAREIKEKGYQKIASQAPEVL